MGGGVSNLISQNQRAAMHIAILEALPARVYALEEMRFKAGSFYDTPDFAEQTKRVPAFSALGLHEWSISQLWRHFTTVSGVFLCVLLLTVVNEFAVNEVCKHFLRVSRRDWFFRVHCMYVNRTRRMMTTAAVAASSL